eukprot:TRINITY_DN28511_c0_g3_i1.p1 TRINITY_DN28511_c0_g3~~TRINITY_DN28511_c0_g3_i1.p1  ORF type:complete len:1082 (+),score=186.59 TRINITY_DN28511_c0_g3_i1:289-3246(+)
MARGFHELKVLMARWCWQDHIVPAQAEINELKQRHASLLTKFREARTSYLKDICELRTQVRLVREGTLLTDTDVTYFFDPYVVLEPEEQQFMMRCVQEKVTMIVDAKGDSVSIDTSQLRRMKDSIESFELKKATETISRLRNQLMLSQEELRNARKKNKQHDGTAVPTCERTHLQEVLLKRVEDQRDALRSELWETQSQFHELEGNVKVAEAARDALAQKLEALTAEDLATQRSYHDARRKLCLAESANRAAEQEMARLRQYLHDMEEQITELRFVNTEKNREINKNQVALRRLKEEYDAALARKTEINPGTHEPLGVDKAPSGTVDETVAEGPGSEHSDASSEEYVAPRPCASHYSTCDNTPGTFNTCADRGVLIQKTVSSKLGSHASDDGVEMDDKVEARATFRHKNTVKEILSLEDQCRKQQTLLQGFVRNAFLGRSERLSQETEALRQRVASLGCGDALSPGLGCGDALSPGGRSDVLAAEPLAAEDVLSVLGLSNTADVDAISRKVSDLEASLEVASHATVDVLPSKEPSGDGGDDGGGGGEIDPQRADDLWQAQQEVGRLRHEKRLAECLLLLARVRESTRTKSTATSPASKSAPFGNLSVDGNASGGACCSCAADLEATRNLLAEVQATCAKLVRMLDQAASENAKLGSVVADMQEAIVSAGKQISSTTTAPSDVQRVCNPADLWHRLSEPVSRRPRCESEEAQHLLVMKTCAMHCMTQGSRPGSKQKPKGSPRGSLESRTVPTLRLEAPRSSPLTRRYTYCVTRTHSDSRASPEPQAPRVDSSEEHQGGLIVLGVSTVVTPRRPSKTPRLGATTPATATAQGDRRGSRTQTHEILPHPPATHLAGHEPPATSHFPEIRQTRESLLHPSDIHPGGHEPPATTQLPAMRHSEGLDRTRPSLLRIQSPGQTHESLPHPVPTSPSGHEPPTTPCLPAMRGSCRSVKAPRRSWKGDTLAGTSSSPLPQARSDRGNDPKTSPR